MMQPKRRENPPAAGTRGSAPPGLPFGKGTKRESGGMKIGFGA